MVCFTGALPPETGLPFVRRVEATAVKLKERAKTQGSAERFEAHAADALGQLVASSAGGSKRTSRGELVIVCDIHAWRRGHAHTGEVCHIIDGGPVPVEIAQELSQDAFSKVVLHDGVNVHTVKHFGRHLPAVLKTASTSAPSRLHGAGMRGLRQPLGPRIRPHQSSGQPRPDPVQQPGRPLLPGPPREGRPRLASGTPRSPSPTAQRLMSLQPSPIPEPRSSQ